jgi:hypothetical protein
MTRGPWKWFDYPDGRKLLAGVDQAVIHCPDAPMTCDPADASLIAASPDMYAALKELGLCFGALVLASGQFSDQYAKAIDAANTALAKADGQPAAIPQGAPR